MKKVVIVIIHSYVCFPIVLIVLLACRFVDRWNILLSICSDFPFTLYGHADADVGMWLGIYCTICLLSKH